MKTSLLWIGMALLPAITWAGAWGDGSFENDDALDWVQNEFETEGVDAVRTAIAVVDRTTGYLEVSSCAGAVAACEVLAAWQGRPGVGIPPDILAQVKKLSGKPENTLREQAQKALDRIMKDSELRDLWADSPEMLKEWVKKMTDLRSRL